jgi:cell division cycle 2-like protein
MSSRWANEEADKALKQKEKAEKARKRLLKQQRLEEEAALRRKQDEEKAVVAAHAQHENADHPAKRQRLESSEDDVTEVSRPLYRFPTPSWGPCRHLSEFETLNAIEEGSYGWVSRARENSTGEIVALKRLKMDNLQDGFPITALREIQTLKESHHKHIVDLREIVVGDSLRDVYLVMEFLEHDMKTLQENMTEPFMISEIKTLMLQITSAIDYLHTNWVLHRDLKTSNILMNNRGEIKIADFGMARRFGDPPPPNMTQLVVTLWYRAPELLLGADQYNETVDIWSLGCILGELCKNEPILQGQNEVDELAKIFALCGVPDEKSWPKFRHLPNARSLKLPRNTEKTSKIRSLFPDLSTLGAKLLEDLLTLNPNRRPDAAEILGHPWFQEDPRPKSAEIFPTFPSKAGQERRRRRPTPHAPRGAEAPKLDGVDFSDVLG